jgi:hypothetical protein
MDRLKEMDATEYRKRAMELVEAYVDRVGRAINQARTGRFFEDCEMIVKEAGQDMSRELMELGAQMRIDSTESSFSPSGRRRT